MRDGCFPRDDDPFRLWNYRRTGTPSQLLTTYFLLEDDGWSCAVLHNPDTLARFLHAEALYWPFCRLNVPANYFYSRKRKLVVDLAYHGIVSSCFDVDEHYQYIDIFCVKKFCPAVKRLAWKLGKLFLHQSRVWSGKPTFIRWMIGQLTVANLTVSHAICMCVRPLLYFFVVQARR